MIKLVVFDLDNVIIDGEAIDEIGKLANVEDEIAEITEKAMQGEIDFETSIKDRVKLLEGTSVEDIQKVADELPLMNGAEDTIARLKEEGLDVAIISGSFDVVAQTVKDKLGIENAYTNSFTVEDGKLTDATGRTVDFTNTVIILTSNLGAEAMRRESSLGFGVQTKRDEDQLEQLHERNAASAREALQDFMRPELINRFDGIITFRALTRKEVSKIFDRLVEELRTRLVAKGIGLIVKPSAKRLLIDHGYDKFNGARPLRRVIEDELEHEIAEGVISGAYEKGAVVTATAKQGKVVVTGAYEDAARQ